MELLLLVVVSIEAGKSLHRPYRMEFLFPLYLYSSLDIVLDK